MSVMMRPDSGTKSRAANQRDVNKHINELQQELTKSKAETQRAREKLNCLISLVRRSWNGDRNASIHLANIVGLDIPPFLQDSGTAGRPGTRMQTPGITDKSRAMVNWERLSVRLLQRDYHQVQLELQEQQQRYIENRSRFMDEVMHFHHQDMSRTPLSRPSSAKMSTVDQQFLQMHSMVAPDGRNEVRQRLNRPKSSAIRARPKVERDVVQQAEVKLRDLFVESSSTGPSAANMSASGAMPAADAVLKGTVETEVTRPKYFRQEYDDSTRYAKGDLFTADYSVLSKKPRPMSAAVLQEKDRMRARPRSAITINTVDGPGPVEPTGERPLKYEATRPVYKKKPSSAAKSRKSSTSSSDALQLALNSNSNNSEVQNPQDTSFTSLPEEQQEETNDPATSQPPISVRVKSAVSRPACVDKFSEDLRSMEEMEAMFKMNTLALQKKLGLPESGIV